MFPADDFMLCTGSIPVRRLQAMGHMDPALPLCAETGLGPIKAIGMASLNAARSFHMDGRPGSLARGRFAVIVLSGSLSSIDPLHVFKDEEPMVKDIILI